MTFRTQQKYSKQLSLPQRDDCKTRLEKTKRNAKQNKELALNPNKQWEHHTTALEQTACEATGS